MKEKIIAIALSILTATIISCGIAAEASAPTTPPDAPTISTREILGIIDNA